MLRHVYQLEKKLKVTESRLPLVRDILSRFSTRLSDAHDLLQRANDMIDNVRNRNQANVLKFQRKEVSVSCLSHKCSLGNTHAHLHTEAFSIHETFYYLVFIKLFVRHKWSVKKTEFQSPKVFNRNNGVSTASVRLIICIHRSLFTI